MKNFISISLLPNSFLFPYPKNDIEICNVFQKVIKSFANPDFIMQSEYTYYYAASYRWRGQRFNIYFLMT